jgi:hypothetical protein
MKISVNNLVVSLIVAVALVSASPASFAEEKQTTLSKEEFKVLLKTAKEPPEHRKIAEYYRQQAQRLIVRAKHHEEMAEIYKNHPLPFEGKYPYGTEGLSHCQRWAELDREQAKEAEKLAALHEDMAKAAEQKQPE